MTAEAIERVEGHSADLARMGRFAILVVALDRVVALARAQAAAQEAPRASERCDWSGNEISHVSGPDLGGDE
jgi:hypothetical protein